MSEAQPETRITSNPSLRSMLFRRNWWAISSSRIHSPTSFSKYLIRGGDIVGRHCLYQECFQWSNILFPNAVAKSPLHPVAVTSSRASILLSCTWTWDADHHHTISSSRRFASAARRTFCSTPSILPSNSAQVSPARRISTVYHLCKTAAVLSRKAAISALCAA